VRQMSSGDAMWLYLEGSGGQLLFSGAYIYAPRDGQDLSRDVLVAHLKDRLLVHPVFRRRLQRVPLNLDFPYWVDDPSFEIENHVRERRLNAPGDWDSFATALVEIHDAPMDMRRPLWDYTLVTGLDALPDIEPGSFAVVTRMHHSMMDGKAAVEVTSALHDLAPDYVPPPSEEREVRPARPGPSLIGVVAGIAVHSVVKPVELATGVVGVLPGVGKRIVRRRAITRPSRGPGAPRTRFNGPVTGTKRLGTVSFALDDVRAVRRLVAGSTVNDVVLATVGGALRRYLARHDELPESSLLAQVPISVRTADSDALGNQIADMRVPLGTHLADPVERLDVIAAATRAAKDRSSVGAKLMTDLQRNMTSTAAAFVARAAVLAGRGTVMANTILSNVPGPQEPIYLAGYELQRTVVVTPLSDGLGMFHGAFSYNGGLSLHFIVDGDKMPDPENYSEDLRAAFSELEAALRG
jgi:diacylglycerol O-acyltransferase / wax synthase